MGLFGKFMVSFGQDNGTLEFLFGVFFLAHQSEALGNSDRETLDVLRYRILSGQLGGLNYTTGCLAGKRKVWTIYCSILGGEARSKAT